MGGTTAGTLLMLKLGTKRPPFPPGPGDGEPTVGAWENVPGLSPVGSSPLAAPTGLALMTATSTDAFPWLSEGTGGPGGSWRFPGAKPMTLALFATEPVDGIAGAPVLTMVAGKGSLGLATGGGGTNCFGGVFWAADSTCGGAGAGSCFGGGAGGGGMGGRGMEGLRRAIKSGATKSCFREILGAGSQTNCCWDSGRGDVAITVRVDFSRPRGGLETLRSASEGVT
jgi:hypothetical protein